MIKLSRTLTGAAALFLVLLCQGIILLPDLYAETIPVPGGDVSGTWYSGDIMLIQGTITVPEGGSLTIQDSVQVIFQGNYQFKVLGRLYAVGSAAVGDSIIFKAGSSAGWGGVRLISADVTSRLEYCHFEGGYASGLWPNSCGGALYVEGTIQAIKHCSFTNNIADFDGGALYLWGGTPEFAYNQFTQNRAGHGDGHAAYLGNCTGILLNQCTFAENDADTLIPQGFDTLWFYGHSIYAAIPSKIKMTNTILWDASRFFDYNSGDLDNNDVAFETGTPLLVWQDSLARFGDDNFWINPFFLGLGTGNLGVATHSPTIDAAILTAPYLSEPPPNGGRANLGAYGNSVRATQSIGVASLDDTVFVTTTPLLNFGKLKLNLSVTREDTFWNVGHDDLVIDSVIFTDPRFSSNLIDTVWVIPPFRQDPSEADKIIIFTFTPNVVDSIAGIAYVMSGNDTLLAYNLLGVGVNPVIEVFPDSMFFETTAVGSYRQQAFWVTNLGDPPSPNGITSDLVITVYGTSDNYTITNFAGDTLAGYPQPIIDTIAVNDTVQYFMRFNPGGQSNYIEYMPMTSNAGPDSIKVSGTGATPETQYSPDTLAFSVVPLNQEKIDTVFVTNIGNVGLALRTATITNAVYSLLDNPVNDTIPPNATWSYRVRFRPTAAGTYNDTLDVTTNELIAIVGTDSTYYTIRVWLFGTGTSQVNWVIGNVSGVWDPDSLQPGATQYVVGPVIVPQNATLTIEPGVTVKFEGNFEFEIRGNLQAVADSAHPILFTTVSDHPDSAWSGLSFLNGSSSSHLSYCNFTRGVDSLGGALMVENSAPLIENCNFYANKAAVGGAAAFLINAQPHLMHCNFYNNKTDSLNHIDSTNSNQWMGGALYLGWLSDPWVEFCNFYGNNAYYGGAIYLSGSSGKISDCNIYDNEAILYLDAGGLWKTGKGGGLYIHNSSTTEITSTQIYQNTAMQGGGLALNWFARPYLHDLHVYQNSADDVGGGIYIQDGCNPLIHNLLVAENTADLGKGIYTAASGAVISYSTIVGPYDALTDTTAGWLLYAGVGDQTMISNSIMGDHDWSAVPFSAVKDSSTSLIITYSDILNPTTGDTLYPGIGNDNVNPQFNLTGTITDTLYGLQALSPALTMAEDGGEIGFFGNAPNIYEQTHTTVMLQHPVLVGALEYVLTSPIPLSAPPYVRLWQDLPDTLGFTLEDSAFMQLVAPIVYILPITIDSVDYPTKAYITFSNILMDTTFTDSFMVSQLVGAYTSSIGLGEEIQVSGRTLSGNALFGLLPENYANPKPLSQDLISLGRSYQFFTTAAEIAEGRIEFTMPVDKLNGLSREHCAIARWNGNDWMVLPSYLNADQSAVWTTLAEAGSYRLIWSENIQNVMVPTQLELAQNYPNPFNPETAIRFALPEAGWVKLEIFDLLGRKVITLAEGQYNLGYHTLRWSGSNELNVPVASGIYFYSLQAGHQRISKKMILLR